MNTVKLIVRIFHRSALIPSLFEKAVELGSCERMLQYSHLHGFCLSVHKGHTKLDEFKHN
jgi:hypothetical protein